MNTSTTDKGVSGAMPTWVRAILVGGLIYAFLVGVSALEAGVKFMGQDTQERLFENVSNPLAGLCIGILGTVLVQSSSASTSVIVGLVAAGAIDIDTAVPMIMGANIGTTVTNTLVALGSARQSNEFRRAFAAATVHDFFNVFAVAILLPLELATGVISSIAGWLSDLLVGSSGSDWKSPVKQWVKMPVGWIKDFWSWVGLTGNTLGVVMIVTGLAIVLISLALITKNMRELIADRVERSMNSVLAKGNGSVAMLLGMVITMLVQSSSITTSILIPMSAAGVITLRNAYPVTLGANVGTTITALLAALATGSPAALTVALTHTVFNMTGILLLYVPPFVRDVPVYCAEWLARIAAARPVWAVGYVMGAFIVLPLIGVIVAR
jgi:sodium-dependent phosphate cotransporter